MLKLAQAGADRITVANRTMDRAARLCALAGEDRAQPGAFDAEALKRQADGAHIVINCTSLGMTGVNGQFEDLSFLQELGPEAGVFDLIYSPAKTELLSCAQRLGLKTANGLGMLVWQGVYALEHFAGTKLDGAALAAAARRALEGKE